MRGRTAAQSSPTDPSSPISMRARLRDVTSANASQPRPEGTTFAPTWQSATIRPRSSTALKRPEPAAGDVLEEDPLDRILGAVVEDRLEAGNDGRRSHRPRNSKEPGAASKNP